MPKNDTKVSLSVGDGGIGFDVIDERGPTIVVTSRFFGNIDSKIKVFTDKKSLLALSKLFADAATKDYSEEYCYKATQYVPDMREKKSMSQMLQSEATWVNGQVINGKDESAS